MEAKKISPVPEQLSVHKRCKPKPDYARSLFWLVLGLQALFLVGGYWEVEILQSTPMFFLQLLAPAAVIVIARSWKSALVYSFFCSLVMPAGICLLLFVISLMSFFKGGKGFLSSLETNFQVGLTLWALILSVTLPAIGLGLAVKFFWNAIQRFIEKDRASR